MFLHAFHTKCLTLFGTFIWHSHLQVCFIVDWFEPPAISLSPWSSYASLYALLTVNLLFLFLAHITLSLASVMLKGMLRIASASWGKKHWLTRSLFHSLLSSSIRSLTHYICPGVLSGVITLYVHGLGIHLSFLTLICLPFPTYHLIPCRTSGWAAMMLLHAYEGWHPIPASTNS